MSDEAKAARDRQYTAIRDGARWSGEEWSVHVERARKEVRRDSLRFASSEPATEADWRDMRPVCYPAGTVGISPELVLGAEAELAEAEYRLAVAQEEAARRPFVWTLRHPIAGTWSVVALARSEEESLGVAAVLLARCPSFVDKCDPYTTEAFKVEFRARAIQNAEWCLRTYGSPVVEVGRGGCVLDESGLVGA